MELVDVLLLLTRPSPHLALAAVGDPIGATHDPLGHAPALKMLTAAVTLNSDSVLPLVHREQSTSADAVSSVCAPWTGHLGSIFCPRCVHAVNLIKTVQSAIS